VGHIFLGVKDNEEIPKIAKEHISSIKQPFVSSVNNTSKLSLTFCLSLLGNFFIDKMKKITCFCVGKFSGSQVHRCATKIFICNSSADLIAKIKRGILAMIIIDSK
jgi:hypothetical protein